MAGHLGFKRKAWKCVCATSIDYVIRPAIRQNGTELFSSIRRYMPYIGWFFCHEVMNLCIAFLTSINLTTNKEKTKAQGRKPEVMETPVLLRNRTFVVSLHFKLPDLLLLSDRPSNTFALNARTPHTLPNPRPCLVNAPVISLNIA